MAFAVAADDTCVLDRDQLGVRLEVVDRVPELLHHLADDAVGVRHGDLGTIDEAGLHRAPVLLVALTRGTGEGMQLDLGMTLLALAERVLRLEAESVLALCPRLDDRFVAAVGVLHDCRGRVIVTGMGKSGLIARKIAATLASTGTPAYFLHPAEGVHGDLGMVAREDVVLALSNSGETDEVLAVLPALKRLGIPLILLTGSLASALARQADIVLDVAVAEEACPINLAPTSSTTAALAMGDALAMALLDLRGLGPDAYAALHPRGSLGWKSCSRSRT
jgi:D-arabinose 5-phosphate isomerase GutQ